MTPERIRRFFAAVSESDFSWVEDQLAEDVVFRFPGRRFGARYEGRRRVMVFLKSNQRLFKGGLKFTVHWVGGGENRFCAQWSNRGVTRGGRDYGNRGMTIFDFDDDRIVGIEDYLDTELVAETWPGGRS